MAWSTLFLFFLSLILVSVVNCRVLSNESDEKNSILISDGVQDEFNLSLDSSNACIHVYGFLPCAENLEGYVFQVFSFGSLLIIGEYFLSKGRSKLFVIFEVGFYGGIIFPLLTMFPRIALMLSTGLTGTREGANSMVGNNVGVTVGYTVFALTMQWGACVVFGLSGSDNSVRQHQRANSEITSPRRGIYRNRILKILVESSVDADPRNKKVAGIMLLTILPFIMVTFSEIFDSKSWKNVIVLITLIVSTSATVFYFVYSYFDTGDQEKSLDHARFQLMSEVYKHLQSFSPQRLVRDGELNQESLKSLFDKFDVNKDGKLQVKELKEVTLEFGMLGRLNCDMPELVESLLMDFDQNHDGEIDENEFEQGITKWLKEYKFDFDNNAAPRDHVEVLKMEPPKESFFVKLFSKKTLEALSRVILGILIVLFLARPFMMNIELLSSSVGVPSFYAIFAVIPLARNLKNALSAHFCRKKDKARIASDTFSEIYKDVTMNNLLGMSIILAVVYFRGLEWDYSTEVAIVVVVGLMIGVPAYLKKTYPLWISVLAFTLYFVSLVLIFIHFNSLDNN